MAVRGKVRRNLALYLTDEHFAYLDSCARIRDIRPSALVNQLLAVIAADHMVAAVLDDDNGAQRANRPKGRHQYRRAGSELSP